MDNTEKTIYILDPKEGEVKGKIVVPLGSPSGMDWDGNFYLLADKLSKLVVRVNHKGTASPLVDLTRCKPLNGENVFLVEDSLPWGIAWTGDSLWISSSAGYSSSLYNLDLKELAIKSGFRAHGPEPRGLYFDRKSKSLLSVDARNLEVRRLTLDGKLINVLTKLPGKAPTGITMDENGYLWIADEKERKIFKVRWE